MGMMEEASRGGRRLAQMRMFSAAISQDQVAQAEAGFHAMAAAAEGWKQSQQDRPRPNSNSIGTMSGWGAMPLGTTQPAVTRTKVAGSRVSIDDDDVMGLVQQVEDERRAEEQSS